MEKMDGGDDGQRGDEGSTNLYNISTTTSGNNNNNKSGKEEEEGRRRHDFKVNFISGSTRLSRWSCGGSAVGGKSAAAEPGAAAVAGDEVAAATDAAADGAGGDCDCWRAQWCAPCSRSPRSPCRRPAAGWRR